jgi:Domain of unknown function (DUF4270)
VQRKYLCLLAGLACVVLFNWNCTKIDTTELGGDLLPAVDNVFTFADTLLIDASREQLNEDDTFKINRSEPHLLGNINNDPIFGKTKADIFVQLKPSFFPFYFGNPNDTINPYINSKTHYDSAFLCLSYTGFYGDSTKSQHFKVYQMDEGTTNFSDSDFHYLSFQPNRPLTNLIGEATIFPPDIKNLVYLNTSRKDSISGQIRIKLDPSFLRSLVSNDTSTNSPFYSDSLFKTAYKGFAIVADGPSSANGLLYVNLGDSTTRIEVHYVAGNANILDTAFSSLWLSTGTSINVSPSANANFVLRDTSTSQFPNAPDPTALYIQTSPAGSAIRLKIPRLSSLTNRIIHRAEIIVEQIPGSAGDDVLSAPQFLYLDLIDTGAARKYKPIYYDLNNTQAYDPDNTISFFPSQGIDQNYFGGFKRTVTDGFGTRKNYNFNITRYVQSLVTKGGINYNFRLFAPYNLYYYGYRLAYKNNLGYGRVKIGNGSNAKFRLRLRIVYSKI